jgi:hypothetical protein
MFTPPSLQNPAQMATGNDPAPSISPDTPVPAPEMVIEESSEGQGSVTEGETMLESLADSALCSETTQPVDVATRSGDERTLRKRQISEVSVAAQFLGPGGADKAARELCRLEGFHGSYPLRQFALETGVIRNTLYSAYNRISEQERALLQSIGRLEAEELARTQLAEQKKQRSEQRTLERTQVGQNTLYLKSGLRSIRKHISGACNRL